MKEEIRVDKELFDEILIENKILKKQLEERKVDYWGWQNNIAKTQYIEVLEKDIEIYRQALKLACEDIITTEGWISITNDDLYKDFIRRARENLKGEQGRI